jgi:hypothetical protein
MLLAIAALMIHPQLAPQHAFTVEKAALIEPVKTAASAGNGGTENSLPSAPATIAATEQPAETSDTSALPDAPVPAPAVDAPAPRAFIKAGKSMTVSIGELRLENRRNQRIWRGLAIAAHGAATFDAWSTRRAMASGAQELNPMLRPFAGNSSLYAAIQVAPFLMDYAGKKMMYSRHSWMRHTWWVPQTASFVSSLFCGAHNLSFH